LENGPAIRRAAEMVKKALDRGIRVVVVVSAIKGVTDQLLAAAEAISPNTPRDVIDYIVGLGEEQSVRLMASALRYLGVDALEVLPDAPCWPIVTDETYGDAEPIIEECESGTELGLRPIIERGKTPVVCGFIGRSLNGNVTTMGRGGGDTTAVILANCLRADELVLVKDVGGVYSADPHNVKEAKLIPELRAWEANLLASTGAKVLHDKVFKYKSEGLRIRIVSRDGNLNDCGTVIGGTIPEIEIKVHENPVFILNIVGEAAASPEILKKSYWMRSAREWGGASPSREQINRRSSLSMAQLLRY